jgi:predicted phosphate transport protein (TIGR00153 family)
MRLPLIPRETKFFGLFIEDGANVLAGARLLEQLVHNYDERERLAAQITDAEHAGDVMTHDIGRQLERTFVTPFDREEISDLINRLDDVLDLVEEVADSFILYNIAAPTQVAIDQAEIIVRQCEQIQSALGQLHSFKGLEVFWIEIHRLENEGDRIARRGIAGLFKEGSDPLEVIKWKDIYALLESAIDACEDVANVIERIVLKHS